MPFDLFMLHKPQTVFKLKITKNIQYLVFNTLKSIEIFKICSLYVKKINFQLTS